MTGDQLRAFRDVRKLVPARLASFLGASDRTLRRYVEGDPDPLVAKLLAVMVDRKLSLEDVDRITKKVWG